MPKPEDRIDLNQFKVQVQDASGLVARADKINDQVRKGEPYDPEELRTLQRALIMLTRDAAASAALLHATIRDAEVLARKAKKPAAE